MTDDLNTGNTITAVRQAHDRVSSLLSHFSQPDATWQSFGKGPEYLEWLRHDLALLTHCVEAEVQRQYRGAPIEYGT